MYDYDTTKNDTKIYENLTNLTNLHYFNITANQKNPTFEDLRYDPFLSKNSVLLDNLTDPQSCSKIIEKTVKIGIVHVSTSTVKLFLETIWSGLR